MQRRELRPPIEPPIVLLSTDVATGLIDTHGAQGSCAVSFDADWPYWRDTDVSPQDIDDGLTLAMGLEFVDDQAREDFENLLYGFTWQEVHDARRV